MFDNTYGILTTEEKERYTSLLCHEINIFLEKIYSRMKRKVPLRPSKVRKSGIRLVSASLGASKAWEFSLNPREQAAKGDVGIIRVVTRGLKKRFVRRQRALLIAAEFYVYHSFANHPRREMFASVSGQNQFLDMVKKVFRKGPSSDLRDRAIRYVVDEVGEHKLAHYAGDGWTTRIAKLERHEPAIASALGASEKTFRSIVAKQHQSFTPGMLKDEEDLVRHEVEELDSLIARLKRHEKVKHSAKDAALIGSHLSALSDLRDSLKKILSNLSQWENADREEHELLRKRVVSRKDLLRMMASEAEAASIDINRVHVLFEHFEKEKVNILHDIELLDRLKTRGD